MQIKKLVAAVGITTVALLGPTSMLRASAATEAPVSETATLDDAVVATDTAEPGAEAQNVAAEGEEAGHSAEGGHGKFTHAEFEARECAEKKLKSGEAGVFDCIKAPNPILPAKGELIWGTAAFLVVLGLLWKFAIPALRKGSQARTAKIEGDLNAAAKAKSDAEAEAATYRSQIGNANVEREQILTNARAEADTVRKDLIARAEADAAEIRQRAADDSAAQGTRLKGELEAHVKRLSVDLAEKVVGANLNRDTNNALVDKYIAELGAK